MSEIFLLYGHEKQQYLLSLFMYTVYVLLANWDWDL